MPPGLKQGTNRASEYELAHKKKLALERLTRDPYPKHVRESAMRGLVCLGAFATARFCADKLYSVIHGDDMGDGYLKFIAARSLKKMGVELVDAGYLTDPTAEDGVSVDDALDGLKKLSVIQLKAEGKAVGEEIFYQDLFAPAMREAHLRARREAAEFLFDRAKKARIIVDKWNVSRKWLTGVVLKAHKHTDRSLLACKWLRGKVMSIKLWQIRQSSARVWLRKLGNMQKQHHRQVLGKRKKYENQRIALMRSEVQKILWPLVDIDRAGAVLKMEICRILRQNSRLSNLVRKSDTLHGLLHPSNFDTAIQDLDTKQEGRIKMEEFCIFYSKIMFVLEAKERKKKASIAKELRVLFDRIDTDGSGHIDKLEMKRALSINTKDITGYISSCKHLKGILSKQSLQSMFRRKVQEGEPLDFDTLLSFVMKYIDRKKYKDELEKQRMTATNEKDAISNPGTLHIVVLSAENLPKVDSGRGTCDAFVRAVWSSTGEELFRTPVVHGSLSPSWEKLCTSSSDESFGNQLDSVPIESEADSESDVSELGDDSMPDRIIAVEGAKRDPDTQEETMVNEFQDCNRFTGVVGALKPNDGLLLQIIDSDEGQLLGGEDDVVGEIFIGQSSLRRSNIGDSVVLPISLRTGYSPSGAPPEGISIEEHTSTLTVRIKYEFLLDQTTKLKIKAEQKARSIIEGSMSIAFGDKFIAALDKNNSDEQKTVLQKLQEVGDYTLRVTILAAEGLPAVDPGIGNFGGSADPYATIHMGPALGYPGQQNEEASECDNNSLHGTTPVMKSTLQPIWEAPENTFDMTIKAEDFDPKAIEMGDKREQEMIIRMWDEDKWDEDDFLGQVRFVGNEILNQADHSPDHTVQAWFDLCKRPDEPARAQGHVQGRIALKLQYINTHAGTDAVKWLVNDTKKNVTSRANLASYKEAWAKGKARWAQREAEKKLREAKEIASLRQRLKAAASEASQQRLEAVEERLGRRRRFKFKIAAGQRAFIAQAKAKRAKDQAAVEQKLRSIMKNPTFQELESAIEEAMPLLGKENPIVMQAFGCQNTLAAGSAIKAVRQKSNLMRTSQSEPTLFTTQKKIETKHVEFLTPGPCADSTQKEVVERTGIRFSSHQEQIRIRQRAARRGFQSLSKSRQINGYQTDFHNFMKKVAPRVNEQCGGSMISSSPNFWFAREELCKFDPRNLHNLSPRSKKLFERALKFNSVLLADSFLRENGISGGLKGCTPQWKENTSAWNDDNNIEASGHNEKVRAPLLPPIQVICDEKDAAFVVPSSIRGLKEKEVDKQEIDLPRL